MDNIDKDLYSLFRLNKITNISDKKKFQEYVLNFIKTSCELYSIDVNNNTNFDLKVSCKLLKEIGIIESENDLGLLKSTIKDNYAYLLNVVNQLKFIKSYDEELLRYFDTFRKQKVVEYYDNNKSKTVVDFFCGAGGMSLGFSQNNYKILLANDIEEVCTETYAFNHPEIPKDRIITGDIKKIVDSINSYITEPVDVIIGGPPCQGFSMANRQRVIDDPRNILYRYYVKGVELLQPKFFVMENVKGMLSVADQVCEDFRTLKYNVAYTIINAGDYGVPQNRERLIYIGIRDDIAIKHQLDAKRMINKLRNYSTFLTEHTLEEALENLDKLEPLMHKNATEHDSIESGKKIALNKYYKMNDYQVVINQNKLSTLIYNHKARYNNERDIEIFERMLPGDKSDSDRIADIMPYTSRKDIFKDKYFKLIPNQKCKTITAHMKFDCNMYIHPYQRRGLTPREAARVQSFPDYYFFLGPYTKTYMQIGNSVPPLLSNTISKVILQYLNLM